MLRARAPAIAGARLAHAVIALGHGFRSTFVKDYRYPAGSTHAVYNGVDAGALERERLQGDRVRAELGVSKQHIVVGSVTRLSWEKGVDVLVRAAALLVDAYPLLQFAILGDGPEQSALEGLIREHTLQDRVRLVGFRTDVAPWLWAMDIFASPSRREGLSFAIVEAMACGRPVVATDVGGTPELVRHAEEGLLVPPDDPRALASALATLVESEARRCEMSERARATALSRFTADEMIARTLEILLAGAETWESGQPEESGLRHGGP